MPRTRAILADPDRRTISEAIMDSQVLQQETARVLRQHAERADRQAQRLRHAQQRLTAAERSAEREEWDGANRRRAERRAAAKLADEMQQQQVAS